MRGPFGSALADIFVCFSWEKLFVSTSGPFRYVIFKSNFLSSFKDNHVKFPHYIILFLLLRNLFVFDLQVLACAPSNVAVDNLVAKLAGEKMKVKASSFFSSLFFLVIQSVYRFLSLQSNTISDQYSDGSSCFLVTFEI